VTWIIVTPSLKRSSEKRRQTTDDVEYYNRNKERLYRRAHPDMTPDDIQRSKDYRNGWLKGVYEPDMRVYRVDDYLHEE